MPVVTASPFTVLTGKNLTIEASADLQGIITQITVEDGASLSLPALMVASSMEIIDASDLSMVQESPALDVNGALTAKDATIFGLVVGENATKLDISGSQVIYMSAENRTLADIQAMTPDCAFYNMEDHLWFTQGELDASVFQGNIKVYPAPAILATPASATVAFGYPEASKPVLDATATPSEGASIKGYQWYKDGTAIEGKTNATYTVPTGLDAGKHTYYCDVTCTDDGGGECILRSKTATVTVDPATLTISGVTLKPKTYNGNTTAEVDSVTFSGPSGDVSLTMGDGNDYTATAEFADASAGTGNKTAIATVTLTNANYTFAEWAKTAAHDLTGQTISPKTLTESSITLTPETFVYDKTEKKPKVTVKDADLDYTLAENTEYTVAYTNNTNVNSTDNVPTVTITDADGGNYNVSGTKTFTITQSGTEFTGDGAVKAYKDNAESSDFTYGDIITVKAIPKPTGEAPTAAIATFSRR